MPVRIKNATTSQRFARVAESSGGNGGEEAIGFVTGILGTTDYAEYADIGCGTALSHNYRPLTPAKQ